MVPERGALGPRFYPEDASAREIARGEFQFHDGSRWNLQRRGLERLGKVPHQHVTVAQHDAKQSLGQGFGYGAVHVDGFVWMHSD